MLIRLGAITVVGTLKPRSSAHSQSPDFKYAGSGSTTNKAINRLLLLGERKMACIFRAANSSREPLMKITALKRTAALLILSVGLLFLNQLGAQNLPSTVATAPFISNAGRLKTGIFTYHDLDHGHEVGRGTVTIRRLCDSERYHFSNDSTFAADFSGFRSQRWEAIATPTFDPISATLAFIRDSEVIPVFDLRYGSGRVTGFLIDRKGSTVGTKRPVDATVPTNTVDQRY